MKLHHLVLTPNSIETAPSSFKIFVNKSHMDFDDAESHQETEYIILTEEEVKGKDIVLDFVKYQNVNSISVSYSLSYRSLLTRIRPKEMLLRSLNLISMDAQFIKLT